MGKGAASRGSEGFVVWGRGAFPACMGTSSRLEPSEWDLLPGYGAHPIDPALGFGQCTCNASALQIWSLQQEENRVGCSCFCWHCIWEGRRAGAGEDSGRSRFPQSTSPYKAQPEFWAGAAPGWWELCWMLGWRGCQSFFQPREYPGGLLGGALSTSTAFSWLSAWPLTFSLLVSN